MKGKTLFLSLIIVFLILYSNTEIYSSDIIHTESDVVNLSGTIYSPMTIMGKIVNITGDLIIYSNLTIVDSVVYVNQPYSITVSGGGCLKIVRSHVIGNDSSMYNFYIVAQSGSTLEIIDSVIKYYGSYYSDDKMGITIYTNDYRIENSILKYGWFGIAIASGGGVIRNNYIAEFSHVGLPIISADGLLIEYNNFTITEEGFSWWESVGETFGDILIGIIAITQSSNVILRGNRIYNTTYKYLVGGIFVQYSDNITLEFNIIENLRSLYEDVFGLCYSYSNGTIYANEIVNITGEGDYEGAGIVVAGNIEVKYNTIKWNEIGAHSESNQTKIYLNNFIQNTIQAEDTVALFWDNGTVGNYWSDYQGKDVNGDGIGDDPYIIDNDSMDRYPLMNPVSPPKMEKIVPPEIDRTPPNIEKIEYYPYPAKEGEAIELRAKVTDNANVSRVYAIIEFAEHSYQTELEYEGDDWWKVVLPPFDGGIAITVKIFAVDINGNVAKKTVIIDIPDEEGEKIHSLDTVNKALITALAVSIIAFAGYFILTRKKF